MKPTMYFLIGSIKLKSGGLTNASLKQASLFAEMGYETYLLTYNFDPNYPTIRKQLIELKKLHKDVIIRNMHEETAGHTEPLIVHEPVKEASLKKLTGGLKFKKRKGFNAYRVYDQGVYKKYIALTEDDTLNYIDYFNENKHRTRRDKYDPWGNLVSSTDMDLSLNKPIKTVFYDLKRNNYMTQWTNPENGDIEKIEVYNKDLTVKEAYSSSVPQQVSWLQKIMDRHPNKSVFVSDRRSSDEVLLKFQHPNAVKLLRLHSNHLRKPYEIDSKITLKVEYGFENIDQFDVALILTKQQQEDIRSRKENLNNLMVIPHYQEASRSLFPTFFKQKKKKLGVVVSRLDPLKNIDHAIKAFEIVVKKIPDAHLDIWGSGSQETKLTDLIKKLKLENNVKLRGFTQNPAIVYQQAMFSLLTSKKEGLPLSIFESMYNKTSVISYDLKYGPADIINDNKNGFIVEKNNLQELADKMIFMFENPNVAIKMGKDARKRITNDFSKEKYKEKWLQAIDFAFENKAGRMSE